MQKLHILPILLFLLLLHNKTTSIQLCFPYTQAYPCTVCQPYAQLKNGLCSCKQGYYMNVADQVNQFCDLCHGSCKSCYGPLNTNCISCPDAFTFVSATATCEEANSETDQIIQQAYSIQGFTPLTGWVLNAFSNPLSSSIYQCGLKTLLGGTASSTSAWIRVYLTSLPNHFRLRVRANFFFIGAGGTTKNASVQIGGVANQTDGSQSGYSFQTCPSQGTTYVTRAVDVSLVHEGATAYIYFRADAGSTTVSFGIRDVIIIAQKCHSSCATCDGYLSTQCKTCTDSTYRSATLVTNGTCQCKDQYYQQPFANTCVDPCPSVPIKYYGDNTTRNCVATCPTGYAYDDRMRCWADCPTTSIRTLQNLYKDNTNMRCVSNCPSSQPYGDPVTRTCYATCPSPRYGVNVTTKICVVNCPHTYRDAGIYKTYASGRFCVPYCPSNTFADPATSSCINPCSSAAFPLRDNSTGQNLCVVSCPPPNRFASLGTCVQICPAGEYGDITTWQCTTTCTSPNWGLQSYNRKCVPICPNGTYAKNSTRTCVNTTSQCNPAYADDYTRKCVIAVDCPFGTYANPVNYQCVTYCPSGRYGHPTTRVCETGCVTPYFADPGVNLCVADCVTVGLYSDASSSRTCVPECNNLTGLTPWADDSTRRCVSDCNNTMSKYLADNTTWKCVFDCPLTHVADFTTSAPKCVVTCPSGWFADATGGTFKICVQRCPDDPPQFGDTNGGLNLCVSVCAMGTYGDETGNRLCRATCPRPYFAQNDTLRRCVKICNQSSFGYEQTCTYHAVTCQYSYKRVCYQSPTMCPLNFFGDNSTNLCVNPCPASQKTFGNNLTKFCVKQCPDNPAFTAGSQVPRTYYADPTNNRWCVLRCSSSASPPLFGNNNTRTCQSKCLDFNSYAQPQSTFRTCIDRCWPASTFHYANNLTKTCGNYNNCPSNYYGLNATQMCVQFCPNDTWGYRDATRRMCLDICPPNWQGDDSSGKRICVFTCPDIPDRYVDLNLRICVDMCNVTLYGDPQTRECRTICQTTPAYFSFQPTRRCVKKCPWGYFADDRTGIRKCQPSSSLCVGRYGDPYLRQCVAICTGPTPVDTFGSGSDCVSFCPNGTYADSYSASRRCVPLCPPTTLNSIAAPNLYGDPTTRRCVARCVTPFTWADRQTRMCQYTCSATPNPSYSQNFFMTCVSALNCPLSPTMTFGDNTTRSCVSFCSLNQWGDPTSRNCVSQCPNDTTTGTSTYYGDNSTGQYLCVVICPTLPRTFGQNTTNLCVSQCPILTYGDQTGNRTCVPKCPLINATIYYFAQNYSRICVTVCIDGTWGYKASRECVEDPFDCNTQWADNSTHLCVDTCPVSMNTFGDPGTRICVPICPNGTYADDLTRTCVTRCPQNNGAHDTFGNNDTFICQQRCTQPNAFADPQTTNRYCVLLCSQSPQQSFADPSTKSCVPRCPTFPSLFGQVANFKCVSECVSPYYADTHSRRCVPDCDLATQFKLRSPRMCVSVCPSSPDLYGDNNTFCQSTCTVGYRYAVLRICVPSCKTPYGLFDYNGTCVKYCPYGYYADTAGHCVSPCPLATLFGENTTTQCRTTCITGYAYDRLCLAICPDGYWGYGTQCKTSCPTGTASNISNLCIGNCDYGTFNQNGICVTNCSSSYADPNTRMCSPTCSLGRYKEPVTKTCVQVCPVGSYRDPSFACKTNCSPLRADNITNTCTSKCSNGTWGYNNLCVDKCPALFYGYEVTRDCYDIPNIPDGDLFADNVTQTWVAVCSENPLRFGDLQSHQCVAQCSDAGEYTDPDSRRCQPTCTNTSYFRDPTSKDCVLICPQGYNANPSSGFCQQNCTAGRYDYNPTRLCVVDCPKPYYGYINGTQRVCVIQCLPGTYAQGVKCQLGCTLPLVQDDVTHRCVSSCIDSYYSYLAGACVSAADCATYGTFADDSNNSCVHICPSDPDYYMENDICVPYCAYGTYADATPGVRECTSLCTEGLYGDPVSGRCLSKCLPGYYAFNDTNLCLHHCPNGYADNETYVCVSVCPAPTFADTLINRCMRICSNGQFGQGRVCVPTCTDGLYGNPITMQCQSGCPDFDYTFAQNQSNLCVRNCSIFPNSYADRNNNFCMDNCSLANQYALDVVGICTSLCPQDLYMQNSTKKCQTGCDTGYAENSTRFCVGRCFGNPQTFAYLTNKVCVYSCKSLGLYADNATNFCVNYDNCSRANNSYSDPISGHCVVFCPQGLYAQDTTFTCTSYCITGFADNLTRRCVPQCPQLQQTYGDPNTHTCVKVCPPDWFAENGTQQCVYYNDCPPSTWSDIKSKHCVARCPSQPLYFGYNAITSCVSQCPSTPDLYGDYVTQICIWPCTSHNGEIRFADATTRICVFVCPIQLGLYGDPRTGRCTDLCDPLNPFKDNSTQRCVAVCPSNPDYYAYDTDKVCVRVCPTGLYASDPVTRICTDFCNSWLTFRDETTNRCVDDCPFPYFADNSTYKCVLGCPTSPDYYADPHTRTCVLHCPIGPNGPNGRPLWQTWIQDVNRTCVTRCPPLLYAQNSSGRCVPQCPPNQYADPILQRCVADCTVRPGYYKETGQRVCVKDCPNSPTKSHRYEVNHICVNMTGAVSGCPSPLFADEVSDNCTSLCPAQYYGDNTLRFCRLNCTSSQFADPYDRLCKSGCTTNPHSFAWTGNMSCIPYCPDPLYSENVTWTCTANCPNMTNGTVLYAYNVTRQCVRVCPIPYYSYILDQTCVLGCPDGWFANDDTRSCQTTCVGTFYADDSTNRCVENCPLNPNYYGLNHVCIPGCPNGTYKDNSTRTCVTDCPFLPLTYADDSTNQCVEDCPSTPNYFADNETRQCVDNCSIGTFADPSTRTCVQNCPDNSRTYAQPVSRVCQTSCPPPTFASQLTNQCVPLCPNYPVKTYALDDTVNSARLCTTRCPGRLLGNNDTRTCVSDCLSITGAFADYLANMCVTTCPFGFFAYNLTQQCRRDCPGLFSDNTTRRCVANCPGTERLYADTTTGTCVYLCPLGWYADDQTWTCKSSCANVTAGYILQVQRRCVPECPAPYFALVTQRICVQNCGAGLYGDQVSRQCRTCPNTCITCLGVGSCLSCTSSLYLQYGLCVPSCTLTNQIANYANSVAMTCVSALRCPANTFGNNGTISCDPGCPTQMYGNSTTRTCQDCPPTCSVCTNLTYCSACVPNAELSTSDYMCYAHCSSTLQYQYQGTCYALCPAGTYVDFTNVNCLACNAICLTCQGTSTNCTTCDGTFYYNNNCVTRCPVSYYGLNHQCLPCTPDVASCVNPLTFKTTTTIEDYQQVIIIKFNQDAKVNSDPTNFIKVNLKMNRRRLADVPSLINNGVGFKPVVLTDGTIKLYLDPGISLENVKYVVSFTDPTQVTTISGSSLQNLQEMIQIAKAEVYPDAYTFNAPLVVVGKILAIIMLVVTFAMLIVGLSPLYLLIQAIQITSLFAYNKSLAPNLFYFLKQMRLSRFVFIPSFFAPIYVEPTTYITQIPQKVLDTEGQLSFCVNGSQFIYFVFFYIVYGLIVHAFTSKVNSNRPLKNLFIKIWETRIKYSIFNDFIWLFAVNVLAQAFMQARYTQNSGDFAVGIISAVAMLALMAGIFGAGVRRYKQDPQSINENYSLIFQGTKTEAYHKFFVFFYYARKILFAAIIVAGVFNTMLMAALGLTLFSLMGLAILIVRPYKQHLTNFVILANEGFLGFLCGGIIYYLKMIEKGQPSGAKITNGYILTIVIIVHLCLLTAWGLYRSYFYIKQLRDEFKTTQFYKLYMDEQYDEILQKQISELNQQQKGQVQSIQVTNIASNQGKQGQENQQDEIIRLKIKRRVKKQKLKNKEIKEKEVQEEHKNRNKADYVKIQKQNENYYKLKNKDIPANDFERVIFDQPVQRKQSDRQGSPKQQSKENEWVKMEKKPIVQVAKKNQQASDVNGYKQAKVDNLSHFFDDIQESRQLDKKSDQHKLQEPMINIRQGHRNLDQEELKRQKYMQTDKKMRETFKSSFADFDQSNFFANQNSKEKEVLNKVQKVIEKPGKSQQKLQDFQQAYEQEFQKQSQLQQVQQPQNNNNLNNQSSQIHNYEILQSKISENNSVQNNSQYHQPQKQKQKVQKQQQEKVQKQKPGFFDEFNSMQQNQDDLLAEPQNQELSEKKQEQYKVFNFDDMQFDDNEGEKEKQKEKQVKNDNKQKKGAGWALDIQDLDEDNKNEDEEQKKRKEKSKKMHMMLFDDEEDM